MRFIEKDFDAPPPGLNECAAKYPLKIKAYNKDLQPKSLTAFKPHLEKIYYGKCAYCESRLELQVEHYRPYKLYWWLYFEWTNLLPACPTCNLKKKERFPLKDENKRITGPGADDSRADSPALLEEEPLLLNPELDDPLDHLVYLPQYNGKIEVTLQGTSEKGKTTVDIFDLNRDKLKENYKRQVDKIVNDLYGFTLIILSPIEENGEKKVQVDEKHLVLLYKFYSKTFRELKELQDPDSPGSMFTYTQLGYHMYEEFDLFILPRLPGNIRILVMEALTLFKEGKLAESSFNIPGINEFKDFQLVVMSNKVGKKGG